VAEVCTAPSSCADASSLGQLTQGWTATFDLVTVIGSETVFRYIVACGTAPCEEFVSFTVELPATVGPAGCSVSAAIGQNGDGTWTLGENCDTYISGATISLSLAPGDSTIFELALQGGADVWEA
ncbi:hypothetical protein DIPPA_18458, partial [Diplonema papillatum]